jgi:hypothetical protein
MIFPQNDVQQTLGSRNLRDIVISLCFTDRHVEMRAAQPFDHRST